MSDPREPIADRDPLFEDVIARATARLRGDPELRLEVAAELRAHLEDAAAECRAAGLPAAEAARQAAAALGDPDPLADDLWQANRRRLRRRSVARWAAGLALVPLAGGVVAACVAVAWNLVATVAVLALVTAMSNSRPGDDGTLPPIPRPRDMTDRAWAAYVGHLPPDDRLFLEGPQIDGFESRELRKAKALFGRWPKDPDIAAYYASWLANDLLRWGALERPPADDVARTLAELDRCAAAEPSNGHYALLKAAVLLCASSRQITHQWDVDAPGFETVGPYGHPYRQTYDVLEVLDHATFERGLAALRAAAAAPYVDAHATALKDRRQALLPAAVSFLDYLHHERFTISTLLPHLGHYSAAVDAVREYAVSLALAGEHGRANDLLGTVEELGSKMAAAPGFGVELSFATTAQWNAEVLRAMLARTRGDERAFADADRRLRAAAALSAGFRARDRAAWQHVGSDGTLLRGFSEPSRIDTAPAKRAEYAVADQVGVAAAAAVLILGAAGSAVGWGVLGLLGALRRWRRSGGEAEPATPAVVAPFIGWRRLAAVVAGGAVLPVAAYWCLATLTPLGGRHVGLRLTWPRLAAEYAVLALTVVALTRGLLARAARRRAVELGLCDAEPATRPRRARLVATLAAAVAAGTTAAVLLAAARDVMGPPNVLLPVGVAALVLAAAFQSAVTGGVERLQRANVIGSGWLTGVLAAVAIVCLVSEDRTSGPSTALSRTLPAAVAMACGLAAAGLAVAWVAGRARRAAWPRSTGAGPNDPRPTWAGSAALAYAAAAVTLAGLGLSALRWHERSAVARFDAAGYRLYTDEPETRYAALRDFWRAARATPATRSVPAGPGGGA